MKEEIEIRTFNFQEAISVFFFELWKWTGWVEFQVRGEGKDRRFRPESVSRSSSPCPPCICQLFSFPLWKLQSHCHLSGKELSCGDDGRNGGKQTWTVFATYLCEVIVSQLCLLSQVSGSTDQIHRLCTFGKLLTSESPFLHSTQGHHENKRQSIQNPRTKVDAQ